VSIHIIIDGYNIIGSESGLSGDLEGKRDQLIKQLERYRKQKGYPITVVFDGWRLGWAHEVRENIGGITVIFSRQGEKADSVIQKLAFEMGTGCVVVTSDREVRRAAEGRGAVAIHASEFSDKLRNFDRESPYDEDQEASRPMKETFQLRKKGNPRKLSKTERKRRERLKNL
jgi:predicted RNA-binding protein with PIN domain